MIPLHVQIPPEHTVSVLALRRAGKKLLYASTVVSARLFDEYPAEKVGELLIQDLRMAERRCREEQSL